jgi:hypothetical protein
MIFFVTVCISNKAYYQSMIGLYDQECKNVKKIISEYNFELIFIWKKSRLKILRNEDFFQGYLPEIR